MEARQNISKDIYNQLSSLFKLYVFLVYIDSGFTIVEPNWRDTWPLGKFIAQISNCTFNHFSFYTRNFNRKETRLEYLNFE